MSQQSEQDPVKLVPSPPVETPPAGSPASAIVRTTGKVVQAITSKQGQRLLTLALFLLGPPLQMWLLGLAGVDPEFSRQLVNGWLEFARQLYAGGVQAVIGNV